MKISIWSVPCWPFLISSANYGTARTAILKNFKSCTKVMEFFFIKVAGYNLTKKALHKGFFMWNLLTFFFGILFFLFWDAFLVFDRKPLLYSLSKSATNRNSEEQLSANYTSPSPRKTKTKKNAQGKFHFSKATCCSTRASNFTLNNVFSIPALLFPITNKTGVVFHFITQE